MQFPGNLGALMEMNQHVLHSRSLSGDSGELCSFSRQSVGWDWMSFSARRLSPGEVWETQHPGEETVHVVLLGKCLADWGAGRQTIGERKSVFDGLPYALYLAPGDRVRYQATTVCEFAECHVPAEGKFPSRLVTPKEASTSLRGGGNASRQIVDVIPPAIPAEHLIAVEVYTPGGNWSSYPPHKHDVHRVDENGKLLEADLEEIYFYKLDRPEGYAYQRVYTDDRHIDAVMMAQNHDMVLVPEGYHPVVSAFGYTTYYLNFLAGSAQSLANADDPAYAWVKAEWNGIDPRLPLVTHVMEG